MEETKQKEELKEFEVPKPTSDMVCGMIAEIPVISSIFFTHANALGININDYTLEAKFTLKQKTE